MSGLLFKWVAGKTVGKIDVGKEDPFFEEIPNEELKFYQRHGAKRKKALPLAYLALLLLKKAQQIDGGLPSYIQTQMSANIAFDFGIGLIPIVGDIINIAYKANSRNCLILESYLTHKFNKNHKHGTSTETEARINDIPQAQPGPNNVETTGPGYQKQPPHPPPRT